MIRKNPNGDLPAIHESAYVDYTAILCGKAIVHDNVFIGFSSVLFNCKVGNYSVVRHNSVVEDARFPSASIFIPMPICAGSSKFQRKQPISPRTCCAPIMNLKLQATRLQG